MTPLDAAADRVRRLRQGLERAGCDALLVQQPRDIRYLTGFIGDDSLLLVGGDGPPAVITDPRHETMLDPWRRSGALEVVMGTRHKLEKTARAVCERRRVRRLGIQAEYVTVAGRRRLEGALGGVALVETEGAVGALRMIKDAVEIAAIEKAIAIHEAACRAAMGSLAAGATELALCAAIEYEMKMRGAFGPSFSTCIAAGVHSAIIHYQTSASVRIGKGTLLVDWGAVVDGYCSDMTRTFSIGAPAPRMRELYGIVLEAQLAAIDAIRPGRTCAEIDSVARDIIAAAGYGEQFAHGLGHGLGLDIHEPPFFNQDSTPGVRLAPGMVMTVEPGIYLPGTGGVRIEDDILVTEGGCRVLTGFPRQPADAVIEFAGTLSHA
jgi:Xaa-Pro aminopeptidase